MRLTDKKILVVGDLMLDVYVHGTVVRLSPEAPVPVITKEYTENRLGGAGNVASNIRALGGRVKLIAVTGTDPDSSVLFETLWQTGINPSALVADKSRTTSVKTRIIANKQQIARLDTENTTEFSQQTKTYLCDNIRAVCSGSEEIGAIVVSDYAKGVISEQILFTVNSQAALFGIPVFLDPKVTHAGLYHGITVITPNQHEAEGLSGIRIVDKISLEEAGRFIVSSYRCKYVLITRGEYGMALFSEEGPVMLDIPTVAKTVYDVSGAGDTVIATLALAYASGMSIRDAVWMANRAAGVVVGKAGTATITKEELEEACRT